jgi:glycosyltransferase involved in cell wall biosynthesis
MKKKILFITRNGLLEPLGQSQILSYLIPLSKEFSINIISFEKNNDVENKEHLNNIKKICVDNNIEWKPLKYRKTIRQLSVILGFVELFFKVITLCKKKRINIIHARSYFPAFIALLIYKLFGIPFVFDMRALWVDELVTSKRLKTGSLAYTITRHLEKKCLKNSASIVSLTKAAIIHMDKIHPKLNIISKASYIPTCTNLEHFKLKEFKPVNNDEKIIISSVGTLLSGWFRVDLFKKVVDILLSNYDVYFEILTRDDPEKVMKMLDANNKFSERITVQSVLFEKIPSKIAKHHGSILFYNTDVSRLGSCPTRMGELFGVGVPILANPGVGDFKNIILENSLGVIIENDYSLEEIEKSIDTFIKLIQEKSISKRCREMAVKFFSLESGVKNYNAIYSNTIIGKTFTNL